MIGVPVFVAVELVLATYPLIGAFGSWLRFPLIAMGANVVAVSAVWLLAMPGIATQTLNIVTANFSWILKFFRTFNHSPLKLDFINHLIAVTPINQTRKFQNCHL